MNLYTRCLHCDTVFKVTTQQLQASSGQVRCGYCQQVFDAFATLTAQEPQAAQPEHSGDTHVEIDVPEVAGHVEPATPRAKEKPAPASRPDPAASLYEWEFKVAEPPRRRGLWVSLSLLLVLLLVGQAVYVYRTELMVMFPQTRGLYVKVCEWLGCSIPLPRMSSFLHIEASDLKAIDPARPNEIELLVSVRNRAPVELAYPAFELTLTNAQDQTISRRVFLPAEYLPAAADTNTRGGLKAGAELPVRLFLDTGDLRAAGYRLYLFYP